MEIKEAFNLGEFQFRNLYRQLETWYIEGLVEKKSILEPGQNEPRFVYKTTKKLEEFIEEIKTLSKE